LNETLLLAANERGGAMPTLHVSVVTALDPAEVVRRLTDFGPGRAEAWANVDAGRVTVHEQGPGWADVTEGNKIGWERERYTWDVDAGTVSATTNDSNLWAAGSGWDYKITPQPSGTLVEVTARRNTKGIKGKLVGAVLAIFGKSMIKSSTAKALQPR
jgi:hypothetical protein